jgi:phytol kinase
MATLTTTQHNVLAAIITIVYVKIVIGISNKLVELDVVSSRITRKIVHIAAGSWIIWWPLFVVGRNGDDDNDDDSDNNDNWSSLSSSSSSWRLNIIVPAIYSIQLLYKGLFLKATTTADSSDAVDPDVQSMTRTGQPRELLNGPLMFTLIMCYVGGTLFRTQLGVIIMSCLGFGDGIAPLVGYYFPYGRYLTWPFYETIKSDNYKTLSGSVAFWLASIIGYYILASIALSTPFENTTVTTTNTDVTFIPFSIVMQIAATSAVAESLTGPYDNVAVAVTAGISYHYLMK